MLLILSGLMLTVLGASQMSGRWADLICDNALGMCDRTPLLAIGTLIALSLFVLQR